MKCPHCLQAFHPLPVDTNLSWKGNPFHQDKDGYWIGNRTVCPACDRSTITLSSSGGISFMAYPKGVSRAPLPPEVLPQFSGDYKEACLVFPDSPKASAALSRRCLQNLLRECGKAKQKDLIEQIEFVKASLPGPLQEAIDAIRVIGNFAAHPMKHTHSGEILDVEPGEAEWLLNVIEQLFDFYFVQPAILAKQKAAMNAKLIAAGKKPLP